MKKPLLSIAFGLFLALLMSEIFFSAWENARVDETRRLNSIGEGETWLIAGQVFAPPAERNCYQGPVGNPEAFLEPHRELGYRLRANLRELPGRLKRGGASLYETTYSTTRFGWRRTPVNEEAGRAAIFLGDSYTFGHGLKATETLPARFAEKTGYYALNLGVPGWGAQQSLRALELGLEKPALFSTPVKAAFFLLGKEMLPRLAGLRLESEGSPIYRYGEGPPKFEGVYPKRGGPLFLRACSWSALCEAARSYFRIASMEGYELPPESSRQLAALISRMEDVLKQRYGYVPFRVISWNVGNDPVMDKLEGDLKERGIDVIPLRSFLPGFPGADYSIPFDGHPSAKAAEEIADFLATGAAGRR